MPRARTGSATQSPRPQDPNLWAKPAPGPPISLSPSSVRARAPRGRALPTSSCPSPVLGPWSRGCPLPRVLGAVQLCAEPLLRVCVQPPWRCQLRPGSLEGC